MRLLGKAARSGPPIAELLVPPSAGTRPGVAPAAVTPVTGRRTGSARVPGPDSFDRIARLTRMALASPRASVIIVDRNNSSWPTWATAPLSVDAPSAIERSLCQFVIDSGKELIIDDATIGLPSELSRSGEPAGLMAWAGFPVREPGGRAVGAVCVADLRPRPWSAYDVQMLAGLAQVASSEVALRIALRQGADRAVLARTLQQILLPPRLPKIPGLQVAARYVAGGTGTEILGDFYDVFPSVRGSWGLVVGDVCGKGIPAAKSTALARHTLRGAALRQTRPSLILAGLNQALLDWPADDPRFLTAIYATVRPRLVTSVRISSAGHPLALVRRADGRVKTVGQPGTLLGLLPDPDLYDTRQLLRPGDSMILFTDGVTEARSHVNRDFYGDERLGKLVGGLGDLPAARMAAAVIKAIRAFSGGVVSDDTVVLVLKVP
ncbi:MAG TPA: GAF domain-containing SpoIIE family protein phosphatase [Streptosporangiaceae bacterium]|nr:GAF domain-containing SpoIIE family protein phosphatase [Streptosporangiaceae bacterium]